MPLAQSSWFPWKWGLVGLWLGPRNSQCSFLFERGKRNSKPISNEETKRRQNHSPQLLHLCSIHRANLSSMADNHRTQTLKDINTYLFHSSVQKPGREIAGSSRKGAPWDPSDGEKRKGSLARSSAASQRHNSRSKLCIRQCCLCCLVYASGTSRLPVLWDFLHVENCSSLFRA